MAVLSAARRTAARRATTAADDEGMVLKGKAPVSNEVLKVKLPKPQEADLAERPAPDGARGPSPAADYVSDHHPGRRRLLRSAPTQIGLASYTASLMREGTEDPDVAADLAGARDDGGVA